MSPISMERKLLSELEWLRLQYNNAIELFMGENRISWELVSIYLLVQVGLVSAVAVLFTLPSSRLGNIRFMVIFTVGAASSVVWYFIHSRSRMRRENWMLVALKNERRLAQLHYVRDREFGIFEIEDSCRNEGLALELFKRDCQSRGEIRLRRQRWTEKHGALKLIHWGMLVVALIWLVLLMLSIVDRASGFRLLQHFP
jgi:hypothetical protein